MEKLLKIIDGFDGDFSVVELLNRISPQLSREILLEIDEIKMNPMGEDKWALLQKTIGRILDKEEWTPKEVNELNSRTITDIALLFAGVVLVWDAWKQGDMVVEKYGKDRTLKELGEVDGEVYGKGGKRFVTLGDWEFSFTRKGLRRARQMTSILSKFN